MNRRILVAGNWKMNGSTAMTEELVNGIMAQLPVMEAVDFAVFPPYPYISQAARLVADSRLSLGAQNLSEQESGAFTGEVSGTMLAELGCECVLVGHSERRTLYGETDEVVAAKFEAAQAAGLLPVLCVGETLKQRQSDETESVVSAQIQAVLDRVGIQRFARAVIAYEPVWAIGTGMTATPEQAESVHGFIRAKLQASDDTIASGMRILYGGSVKGSNAADLFARDDIDGGLIGGASLTVEAFMAIGQAAQTLA